MSVAVPSRFPEIEQDSAKQIGDIAVSHRMRSLRVPKRTAVGRRSLTWIRNNYRRVVTPFWLATRHRAPDTAQSRLATPFSERWRSCQILDGSAGPAGMNDRHTRTPIHAYSQMPAGRLGR